MISLREVQLLHPTTVHIWKIPLDQDGAEQWMSCLSKEEQQKAEQFAFIKDRRRYIVAHRYCRLILSRYLRVKANQIEFSETEMGKPVILNSSDPAIHYNLTHSHSMALVAVSTHPVGVDIEYIDPTLPLEDMAIHIMSPQEWKLFQQLPQQNKIHAFYYCWTRKEAYVKALGKGLSYPIQQVTVSLCRDTIDLWMDQSDPQERKKWRMFHIHLSSEYVGAVVCQGEQVLHFSVDHLEE